MLLAGMGTTENGNFTLECDFYRLTLFKCLFSKVLEVIMLSLLDKYYSKTEVVYTGGAWIAKSSTTTDHMRSLTIDPRNSFEILLKRVGCFGIKKWMKMKFSETKTKAVGGKRSNNV